jgi:ABC-2 type transport system permease protein
LPNFRETDPSKIAVGFGGTLNLVAGLLFLLVAVAALALPFHLLLGIAQSTTFENGVPVGMWAVVGAGSMIGVYLTMVALRTGARHLRTMEF